MIMASNYSFSRSLHALLSLCWFPFLNFISSAKSGACTVTTRSSPCVEESWSEFELEVALV